MTADCLPLLLCADDGSVVGAVHAGWRGLLAGVIEAAIREMGYRAAFYLAWLGPAIGPLRLRGRRRGACRVRGGRWRRLSRASTRHPGALAGRSLPACPPAPGGAGFLNVAGGDDCCTRRRGASIPYRRDGVTGRWRP